VFEDKSDATRFVLGHEDANGLKMVTIQRNVVKASVLLVYKNIKYPFRWYRSAWEGGIVRDWVSKFAVSVLVGSGRNL